MLLLIIIYHGTKKKKRYKNKICQKYLFNPKLELFFPYYMAVVRTQGHTNRVSSLMLSMDNKLIVSGSHDKTIRVWDAKSGECKATLKVYL